MSLCFATQVVFSGSQEKTNLENAQAPTVMLHINGGPFIMGSTRKERDYGYGLDEKRGSFAARKYQWFENETRRELTLPPFSIDRDLVTNQAYQKFVQQTAANPPYVNDKTWANYGLVHGYKSVTRFLWQGDQHPQGRGEHPVVLVSHADAQAYCHWRGQHEKRPLGLPSEAQWEKSARGAKGYIFPWGNQFSADKLNSIDKGPYDTRPVGRYPAGNSPFNVRDMAGMVFEWTQTACASGKYKFFVKGGSWDDYPGVTRSAARHCRQDTLKHILIGFRCSTTIH